MTDIILGAGEVFWDQENANGDLTGSEILLAETPNLSMSATTDRVTDYSSDGKIAEKIIDIAVKLTRELKFELKDMALANVALFVIGSKAAISQSATPVVGENVGDAQQGNYMQLGKSVNKAGVRGVGSVTIKVGAAVKTIVTDYTLNAAMGRIYIVPGGGIANAAVVLADFTPTVNSREQVSSDQLGAKFGGLRFIADNTSGPNRDYYWPRVGLNPDGELGLKSRDAVMKMSFSGSINTRSGFSQVYIDGRPA